MIHHDTEPTNMYSGDDRYGGKVHPLLSSKGGGFTKVAPSSKNKETGELTMADEYHARDYTEQPIFHGLALARDVWLERYGVWIVMGFTGCLAVFLLAMTAMGHLPGRSFPLKSGSDIMQMLGEALGSFFCLRIALRLRRVFQRLKHELERREAEQDSSNELATTRHEVRIARRAWLAWGLLAIGTALYTCGAAIWLSYDVRMPTADIPLPGLYNLGFSGAPPFFLVGILLLTRRSRISIGHARLLLDALAVLGAAFALSWFFVLGPTIANLSGSFGAEVISIYIPTSDLFLMAVVVFLLFSPLSSRHQHPVFLRLCLGIFCLAITDGLLAYFSLSPSGFNTGTLQDTLWPLSMMLIGLAAIEYPRCVAHEQAQAAGRVNPELVGSLLPASGRASQQISTTLQTIAPFLLALLTSTILLTAVASRGGPVLLQADLIALMLIVVVGTRQALTLIENSQLTRQIHGELVVSQDELKMQRQEALTDAITGLPNHRAVMSRIDDEVSRCQRTQASCAVLFLDLDHFKRINDTWGHRAGDAILWELGNRLRGTLRQQDFVGRYGGEEFAIVLVDVDADEAYRAAERTRAAVADQPCFWEVKETRSVVPIAVTTSIGVAVYQLHGESRDALIEAADQAMYQAKHSGRNRVCLLDSETTPIQEKSSTDDAMLSDRPYRKTLSVAQARAELQHCSGSQFDPMVVEAFLQVLDEREALQGERASAIEGETVRGD
jgi:diguanylate cyclase (GGDEF)-like protein